jgi:hypothetical protein
MDTKAAVLGLLAASLIVASAQAATISYYSYNTPVYAPRPSTHVSASYSSGNTQFSASYYSGQAYAPVYHYPVYAPVYTYAPAYAYTPSYAYTPYYYQPYYAPSCRFYYSNGHRFCA